MIYFLSLSLYLILYLSIYLFIYLSSSKICLVTDSPIVVKFGYWLIPHFSKIWLLTDSSFLYYLAIDSFPILVILSISVRAPVLVKFPIFPFLLSGTSRLPTLTPVVVRGFLLVPSIARLIAYGLVLGFTCLGKCYFLMEATCTLLWILATLPTFIFTGYFSLFLDGE